jgi:2-dehydro-3-deoxyphosphooctonate aldolase (KDO 8-P synthase)
MITYSEIKNGPFVIAGPCVIENEALLHTVAGVLVELREKYRIPIIFKASFDKANRTSVNAFRGPGLEKGLESLKKIKDEYKLPVCTDIHEPRQAVKAAEVVDIIQIPAFLCRQTDLLLAAGKTGKIVNIKKAQFLSAADMQHPVQKVLSTGNEQILLTERGTMMGYNNLVVDFRNIPEMKKLKMPVVMDCTHSVQKPGGGGDNTTGNREYVPAMAMAAKAFGADGYFFEVHPDPENAKSDGPNMIRLHEFDGILNVLLKA